MGLQAFRAALRQTPLSTDRKESAGAMDAVSPSYTWFHARHWYSNLNSSMEVMGFHDLLCHTFSAEVPCLDQDSWGAY